MEIFKRDSLFPFSLSFKKGQKRSNISVRIPNNRKKF